ncbi:MAG: hypothetical protein WD960_00725 [Gemmatimonadota bacterium]
MNTRTRPLTGNASAVFSGLAVTALLLAGCGADEPQDLGDAEDSRAPVLVEARDEARADADQVEVELEDAEAEVETRVAEEWDDDVLQEERLDEDRDVTVEEQEAEEAADAELRSVNGIIVVTGTGAAPTATLRQESGGSLGLVGSPARELLRLSGARVRVEGRQANTPIGPGLTVERYEILEIGDRVPEVGVLRALDGATWELEREGADPLVLEALPTRGMQEGMKIWVVGQEVAPGRLLVESHGVIAPAG